MFRLLSSFCCTIIFTLSLHMYRKKIEAEKHTRLNLTYSPRDSGNRNSSSSTSVWKTCHFPICTLSIRSQKLRLAHLLRAVNLFKWSLLLNWHIVFTGEPMFLLLFFPPIITYILSFTSAHINTVCPRVAVLLTGDMWWSRDNIMQQIAGTIWTFGCVLFIADRRGDHRLDQSAGTAVLSEPSETHEASNKATES